jgi:hypothetical protein
MKLRAEHQWKSYSMTSRRWVVATDLYNTCLTDQNMSAQIQTVPKKPRALMEKLGEVEGKVIDRILTGNFKCKQHSPAGILTFTRQFIAKSGGETFWKQACEAVALVKPETLSTSSKDARKVRVF